MNEISYRYAFSLYLLGKENNKTKQYFDEFLILKDILKDNPKYVDLLNSKLLDISKKKELLEDALKGIDIDIVNLLKIIIENNRFNYINDIIDNYIYLVNKSNGVQQGIVYSTIPLDEKTIKEISSAISEKQHQEVYLINKIDPSLIGGIKVVIEEKCYDHTIKNQLKLLKEKLTKERSCNEN